MKAVLEIFLALFLDFVSSKVAILKNLNNTDLNNVAVFLLSSLVTGLSFIWIWLVVRELQKFSFMMDWPEIHKLGIPMSEFCSISGDGSELRMLQKVGLKTAPHRLGLKNFVNTGR